MLLCDSVLEVSLYAQAGFELTVWPSLVIIFSQPLKCCLSSQACTTMSDNGKMFSNGDMLTAIAACWHTQILSWKHSLAWLALFSHLLMTVMWYSYKIDDPSDDAFSLQFHSCCSIMSSKNVIFFFSHTAETIVNVLDFKKDVGLWHGILTVSKPSSCKCV